MSGNGHTGLSRNVLVVGSGLVIIGLGSLGLLAIVSCSLEPDGFAQFGVWFGLANVIAFGLFVPLETAIARAMLGSDGLTDRMRRQIVTYTGSVLVGMLVVGLVFQAIVVPRLMGDSWLLAAVTMIYLGILAMQATQRALSVGRDRFWPLFWQFGTDGVLRLLLPGLVAASGSASPEAFAIALVGSSTVGLAAGQVSLKRSMSGSQGVAISAAPGLTVGIDLAGLGALVVAAVGAQLLANGAPPILSLFDRDTAAVLAGVVAALALTRMPLLFSSAVQSPLLPPMVRSIRDGDIGGLWSLLRRIGAVFAILFVGAWFAGWYLGSPLLDLYLGDDYGVTSFSMALLSSAGVALLAVVAVQAAVVAASANAVLAISWALGIATYLSIMVIPASGLTVAPVAITLGTAVTLLTMLIGLRMKVVRRPGLDNEA